MRYSKAFPSRKISFSRLATRLLAVPGGPNKKKLSPATAQSNDIARMCCFSYIPSEIIFNKDFICISCFISFLFCHKITFYFTYHKTTITHKPCEIVISLLSVTANHHQKYLVVNGVVPAQPPFDLYFLWKLLDDFIHESKFIHQ